MHADTLRVTGCEAVIMERRPPLIAVTFTTVNSDGPRVSYLLEPRPAFDFADGLAALAFELSPGILRELRVQARAALRRGGVV